MISRLVKIQIVLFLIIGLGAASYAGITLVAPQLLSHPYVVKAQFADSGGIFTRAEVTYRGVNVGRVGNLHLLPDGVEADLSIDRKVHIPADVRAVVANKSAVGEQYVDLQPQSEGAPFLHRGDVITKDRTSIPVPVTDLLQHLDALSLSVNTRDLVTLVDELGKAFSGTGPALQRLVVNGDTLTRTLQDSLPATVRLIQAGKIDLETARAVSGSFSQFTRGIAALSEQLRISDPDLRRLLDNGITASHELDSLLTSLQPNLYSLLGNLVTANRIQVARIPGLRQTLVALPEATAKLQRVIHGHQLYNGLVTDSQTPSCTYPTTPRRIPHDTKPGSPHTDAYCPSTPGTNPRGARNVPRPPGDTTAGPGNDNGGPNADGSPGGPSTADTGPALITYDPYTGLASANGAPPVVLGADTGANPLLQGASWETFLLALISR